jgi:hypothetical protein
MSDLQDLIATNAVRAYNEGLERGVVSERERIIELLEIAIGQNGKDSWLDAIELIKGEPK